MVSSNILKTILLTQVTISRKISPIFTFPENRVFILQLIPNNKKIPKTSSKIGKNTQKMSKMA